MHIVYNIGILIFAYLIGSIPTSVWIGKSFFNTDVREHGSRNAGSTNAIRVLGWKAGLTVLIIDIFKGWLAVNLIHLTNYYIPETGDFIEFQLLLGIAAILGHIFPVYVGFRGGKGVATLFGLVLAINPEPTLALYWRICNYARTYQVCFTEFNDRRIRISYPGDLCF